jgi:hypothetical protein
MPSGHWSDGELDWKVGTLSLLLNHEVGVCLCKEMEWKSRVSPQDLDYEYTDHVI